MIWPERAIVVKAAQAVVAISAVSLLFIGSYAGALHAPKPHRVPLAVSAQVPRTLVERLEASSIVRVSSVADTARALRSIDRREAYGALVPRGRGLELVLAPAAGPAVAGALEQGLEPRLRQAGVTVSQRIVHPLPTADSRGLVGFYTAVGWVVAGYLGATFLGIIFGTQPGRLHTLWRLAGLAVLALIVGFAGAAMARAIGDFGGSLPLLGLVGFLTVAAVGAVTIALQSLLGIVGTGVSILIFVVIGNPSSGGPFPNELLPGFWRTLGPLIPTGASTTAIRQVAYFPAAPLGKPLAVLLVWLACGVVVSVLFGHRRGALTPAEAEASLAMSAP